ncbi:DedA family protein [Nocardioides sp.]|uniref:DedA family protein n=1 Tax=Nocardioides sp. TaxID=35761 RepID=UPI0035293308
MTLLPAAALDAALSPLLFGISWMDPEWLLARFGTELFWISLIIVFIECGLLFPFLPGDTLLFSLGIFIAAGTLDLIPGSTHLELAAAVVALLVAAFLGNVSGYEIGRLIGPRLHDHDGRIIKQKHVRQTDDFFTRHGGRALVLGRFVPFVRTYVTVVAGVTEMPRQRFWYWSLVGAALWVLSITLLGYFLGNIAFLRDNIDAIAIVIVAFSLLPVMFEWWRHRRKATA